MTVPACDSVPVGGGHIPRYLFDLHDGAMDRDRFGPDLDTPEAASRHAGEVLPAIAPDEVPSDGDRRAYPAGLPGVRQG